MIPALLLLSAQAPTADSVKKAAEAVFAVAPSVASIPTDQAWVKEPSKDPRDRKFRLAMQPPPPIDPELVDKINALVQALQDQYGDDAVAMAKDPRTKEVQRLAQGLNTPAHEAHEAALAKVNREIEVYDRATLKWLNANGYAKVPSYTGRMALILDRPLPGGEAGSRSRSWTVMLWHASNRFYQSSVGRMIWTGGYAVLAVAEVKSSNPAEVTRNTIPPRRIERPSGPFAQMHLGREGWYIKFSPVRAGDVFVPMPTLSTLVRNLNLVGTGQSTTDIGNGLGIHKEGPFAFEVMLGYPLSGTGKAQRGAVQTTQADGAVVRIAWDFGPG